MKMVKRSLQILSLIAVVFLAACTNPNNPEETQNKPKNIILLIGDGMGVSQIYAGMMLSEDSLNMEKFQSFGFSKTYSSSHSVTDSGAGGTAIACGKKTYNGAIGVDSLGNPIASILELAEENGLATGLVSTSSITHATPASFIAHEKSRNDYVKIARDFLDTDIDVFIGGGQLHFRNDSIDYISELEKKSYQMAYSMDEAEAINSGKLAALLDSVHLPSMINGRGNILPRASQKAIELLDSKENGFFLMIEGSQIDWGGHANDIDYIGTEVLDFDQAVGKALEFAKKDKNTLVIVTADHETGGLAINGVDFNTHTITPKFSTGGHTGVMVPILAYGPGADEFQAIMQNTEIFAKMKKLFDF